MATKILVAVDLEDACLTEKMLRIAGEIASQHDAKVTLIHVAAKLSADVALHLPDDFQQRMSVELTSKLKELADSMKLPPEATQVHVRHGSIYREILAQAEADEADLIVIGCHKPDAADFLLGSNSAKVSQHATCSVFMVR